MSPSAMSARKSTSEVIAREALQKAASLEDELHALANGLLSVWEGSDGFESVHNILDESADERAGKALGEIAELADAAITIYRRRVGERLKP